MEMIQCSQCGNEIDGERDLCPHCGAVAKPIPNYPRFGSGWFMAMWIFFVILVGILLVTLVAI
jgi:prepilin signal peptidase PulO-like enzyme (type II secretory pathway)